MFGFKGNINKSNMQYDIESASKELSNGSVEAFNFLYERYQNKVYCFCVRMLGNRDIAKDAYQDIFLKVYDKRNEFKGDNFSAWLFTIARNTCLNIIRSRKQYVELEEDYKTTDSLRQSDIEMKEFIEKSLMKLPLAYREVLILREYEDCSYQEMSEILNINVSNVKVRVLRARILMRKILTPIFKEYYGDAKHL